MGCAFCESGKLKKFRNLTVSEMILEVLTLIKDIANTGLTMIIVTHELSFAKKIATRVLFMDNGKILEDSSTENFFKEPKTKRAKEFLTKVEYEL